MKKLKHNKIKNTAIIFEVLMTKLVGEIMEGHNNPPVLKIIRNFFNSNSVLYDEMSLYRLLMNIPKNVKNVYEYVDGIVNIRKKLSESTLKRYKYNVIHEMKKMYGDDFVRSAFNVQFKNYKAMASIYKLFEYEVVDNPISLLEAKNHIIERATLTEDIEKSGESLSSEWMNEKDSVRKLGLSLFVKKFNEKYKNLLSEQKRLLATIINRPNELFETFFIEKAKIISSIRKNIFKLPDETSKVKISAICEMVEKLEPKNTMILDEHIKILMRLYNINDVLKNEKKLNNLDQVNMLVDKLENKNSNGKQKEVSVKFGE